MEKFYFEQIVTQGLNKCGFTLFTALYCTVLSKHPIQNLKEKAMITQTLKTWTRTCWTEESIYGNQPNQLSARTRSINSEPQSSTLSYVNKFAAFLKKPVSQIMTPPFGNLHGAPGAEQFYNILKILFQKYSCIYYKTILKKKKKNVRFTSSPLLI